MSLQARIAKSTVITVISGYFVFLFIVTNSIPDCPFQLKQIKDSEEFQVYFNKIIYLIIFFFSFPTFHNNILDSLRQFFYTSTFLKFTPEELLQ